MARKHTITRKGFGFQVDAERNGQFEYRYSAKDFGDLLEVIATQALGYSHPHVSVMLAGNTYELTDCHGRPLTSGSPSDLSEMIDELPKPQDLTLEYQKPTTKTRRFIAWIADNF